MTNPKKRKAGRISALRRKGLGPQIAKKIANGRRRKKKG
jgi:hypothetical protein